MSINFVPRVTQLDAVLLDLQLEELYKQKIFFGFKYLEPGLFQPILPEIEFLIRTWLFKYSIWDNKHTFGQQMLSLKYRPDNFSKSKLYWYYGYTIGLKYLKERSIYSYTSNTRLQTFIQKMETFQLVGDMFTFIKFIQNGKYPVLIDLILGLQLTADRLTREDLTDFSWTRELLWHNFIELIGTTLSIMNVFGLRTRLTNILKYVWWRNPTWSVKSVGAPTMTVHTVCACCSNTPVLPHMMGCCHIFCYYCLVANKTVDENFPCPKCYYNGKEIKKLEMI